MNTARVTINRKTISAAVTALAACTMAVSSTAAQAGAFWPGQVTSTLITTSNPLVVRSQPWASSAPISPSLAVGGVEYLENLSMTRRCEHRLPTSSHALYGTPSSINLETTWRTKAQKNTLLANPNWFCKIQVETPTTGSGVFKLGWVRASFITVD
jgi:hypothetical protein